MSSFSSYDSTTQEETMFIGSVMAKTIAYLQNRRGQTSRPRPETRKLPLRKNREAGNNPLIEDYFLDDVVYAEKFRRRFRMRKELFLRIVGDLEGCFPYFKWKLDARKKQDDDSDMFVESEDSDDENDVGENDDDDDDEVDAEDEDEKQKVKEVVCLIFDEEKKNERKDDGKKIDKIAKIVLVLTLVKTSWTPLNPGRRFYACPTKDSVCRFIGWVDLPMCARSNTIIPGLLRNINTLEERCNGLVRSINMLQEQCNGLLSRNNMLEVLNGVRHGVAARSSLKLNEPWRAMAFFKA
uniref:Zinc finger GRF-type domain-containing protein n=1 Tax=Lactuca sativa TaxID=4236 RepID=A0A9R1V7Y4_LACSA|nr:hypothetical protein LSAT_V11C600302490 [Lactuca sativa]